ncbi:uncharacterized protein LOC131217554 [Magnolia sinica]|uniref:uncharacterized protein LOC131217554 n=1 Tax=Magnolia sinica TaxID=86752 RepID=UPI00265AF914|nr:uncharacterized protein LOC131217554 [Magnolia sinica]
MKSIGASWKEWKKRLKKEHYKQYLTNEERLAHCSDRVESTHWKWLVTYWSSDEGQARTQRNKINRSKHRMAHTAGLRSFAQVREEERAKNLGGESPDRATLFITTHQKKDGSVVNEESAHVIVCRNLSINDISDNIFHLVMILNNLFNIFLHYRK